MSNIRKAYLARLIGRCFIFRLYLINSFYSISLLVLAFAVWVVWGMCIMMYLERFWAQSNEALQCTKCTDKLCTQYCRKLQKLEICEK